MKKQFKIYKEGTTRDIITILSKEDEPFDFKKKVLFYLELGYIVYDLEGNKLTINTL